MAHVAAGTAYGSAGPELGRDDELVSLQGSFAPFPLDAAERQRTADPRRRTLARPRRGTRATLEAAADAECVVAARQRRPVLDEGRVLARVFVAQVARVDEQLELHTGHAGEPPSEIRV